MSLHVDRLRQATPGVADHIHLNNAGAALPTQAVLDAQVDYLLLEGRVGGYRAAQQQAAQLRDVRSSVARLLGANAHEVALHRSATDAWNTAVLAICSTLTAGSRLLVDHALYGSHAITLLRLQSLWGLKLELVDSDALGQLDLEDLSRRLDGASLACLTHVPTSSGLVNPLEAAGTLCADAGVPLIVDACQSVGQLPVQVDALKCAALSATGRKYLRGPRGTGFLYVRQSAFSRFPPLAPDLRAAEWVRPDAVRLEDSARRYEAWERSFAAELGLGVAIEDALQNGIAHLSDRICALAADLRQMLASVPGVRVHDQGERLCGICTFSIDGHAPVDIAASMQRVGITVSVTHRSSAQHDLGMRGLAAVVRASVHAYNNTEELERSVEAVAQIASGRRSR